MTSKSGTWLEVIAVVLMTPFLLIAMGLAEHTVGFAIILMVAGGAVGLTASFTTIYWTAGILGLIFVMMFPGMGDHKFGTYPLTTGSLQN
jgi:hypothetical protein